MNLTHTIFPVVWYLADVHVNIVDYSKYWQKMFLNLIMIVYFPFQLYTHIIKIVVSNNMIVAVH